MKIELQSECIDGIVRADLMSVRKNLRDEDGFEPYGTECAAAIRARGEV